MATVMKTTREVKGVGLSIPRADGAEKVTGKTEYVADLKPKGMLHAKLLRSPHAHARIKRIDTSEGQGPARRAGGRRRGGHSGAQEEGADAGSRRARHRSRRVRRPAGGRRGRRRAGHRRGGLRPDPGRLRGPARRGRSAGRDAGRRAARGGGRHRGRHQRGARPLRRRRGQVRGQAVEGREHLAAGQDQPRRPGQGLRRVRRGHREDVPHPDGAPGLPRAARGPGPVGPAGPAHALGQHPGLVQHALRGRRHPRARREPDQGHPDGVRRRLRRQDPRALRADHGRAGQGLRPTGPLRDDPARGAGRRQPGAPGDHQAEDRRASATAR